MTSFEIRGGCFYRHGKPFIKTTAYGSGDYLITLPEDYVLDLDKNLYLRAGFTCAEYWPRWREVNPADGVWNLQPLRTLLERARRMGIAVFIHFDPSPPKWMSKKYGWYVLTETGRKLLIPVGGMVPHDENYIREMDNYVKHIIDIVREYDDVVADYWLCGEKWVLMTEFKEVTIEGVREDASYDDLTVSKFRKWLKGQFSLEELGVRWNMDENTYSSWDEVYPPISLRKTDFKNRPLKRWRVARWDWYRFKQHLYVWVWKSFCDIVHKYDPTRPISLEVNMDLPGFAGHGRWYKVCAVAPNAHAGVQDFEASFVRALYYLAIARGSSSPPHQVNEMSGFQDYRWCIRNAWFIQAMGGTGMTFWDFKSEYWGLVTGRGWKYDPREKPQFKESYLAVSEINSIFRRLMNEIGGSSPLKPTIGVLLIDEDSFHEEGVSIPPTMRILKSLLELGYGFETVIANEEHLDRDKASRFKLILAPHIKYISEKHAERLREYVERGGILVLWPFAGEYNELGDPYTETPCKPLAEVSGVETKVDMIKEATTHLIRARNYLPERLKAGNWLLETMPPRLEMKVKLALDRNLAFDYIDLLTEKLTSDLEFQVEFYGIPKGTRLKGIPVQEVRPRSGASVIALHDGAPSIVLNKYGRGYTVYLASEIAGKDFDLLMRSLLSLAGLSPYVEVKSSVERELGILWGLRRLEEGYIMILIENADVQQDVRIRFNEKRLGFRPTKVRELIEGKDITVDGELRDSLKPCEVKVYSILK